METKTKSFLVDGKIKTSNGKLHIDNCMHGEKTTQCMQIKKYKSYLTYKIIQEDESNKEPFVVFVKNVCREKEETGIGQSD